MTAARALLLAALPLAQSLVDPVLLHGLPPPPARQLALPLRPALGAAHHLALDR